MPYLCPSCREPLPASLDCACGQRFACSGGVLALVEPGFGRRLDQFTVAYSQVRAAEGRRILDEDAYESLPYGPHVKGDFQWRLRQYDLSLVRRLLRGRQRQRVLDVGAWNGWLSHRLAGDGHAVTAVDYFVDEYDGLRARRFYSTTWQAIQLDLRDLSILDELFDVVILNRCVQFFRLPADFVAMTQQKLAARGLLILTGLEFFQDARDKALRTADMAQVHRQRYGFDLFLTPTKGYLDFVDLAQLRAQGVQFKPYWQLLPANLKSMLRRTLPRHYYGTFFNA